MVLAEREKTYHDYKQAKSEPPPPSNLVVASLHERDLCHAVGPMGHVDHFSAVTFSVDRVHLAPQGLGASLGVLLISMIFSWFPSTWSAMMVTPSKTKSVTFQSKMPILVRRKLPDLS